MALLLENQRLVLHDGTAVNASEYLANKVVALYFGAGFCLPCRLLTPKLKVQSFLILTRHKFQYFTEILRKTKGRRNRHIRSCLLSERRGSCGQ